MRLIDADVLKYALGSSDEAIYFDAMIDEMPTIESAPVWTPCSEGMPEDGEWIFVTVEEPHKGRRVAPCISIYDAERRQYFPKGERGNKDELITNVVAWRKYPAPYQGEK